MYTHFDIHCSLFLIQSIFRIFTGAAQKTLYHFTDTDSAEKIAETGIIKQSKGGPRMSDAIFGDGVYATTLRPNDHTVNKIAYNNWDDGALPQQKIEQGKLDAALQLQVTEKRVTRADTGRSIYVVQGDVPASKIKDVYVRDQQSGIYFNKNGKK